MKKYKVIALSLGGLNNKIFESGDIVTEGNFPPGRIETLVKEGFISPLTEEEISAADAKAKEEADKAAADAKAKEYADKAAASKTAVKK